MTSSLSTQRITVCALAALGTMTLPAWGDVTLFLQQAAAQSGAAQAASSAPAAPRSITLSFHANDARLEIAGGPILLYDGKEGTIETLHPAEKTYDMSFTSQLLASGTPSLPGSQATASTHLDLHQTDQTMTIAGVTAHKYLVVGSISYARPQGRSFNGRGGGRRHGGGGGFPGGRFPLAGAGSLSQNGGDWSGGGEGGGRRQGTLPQYSMGGEVWLSDVVKLPQDKNATMLPLAQLMAAGAGPLLQPLTDALNGKKDLPLLARITVTRTLPGEPDGAVDAYGGVMEGNSAGTNSSTTTTIATTLTVQAISNAPVDQGQFDAPNAFALVPAPVEPFDPALPPAASVLPASGTATP